MEAATWVDATTIQEQFLEFHLEEKVDFWEGSNVGELVQEGKNQNKGLKVSN